MAAKHCPSAATHQMYDPGQPATPGASWMLGSKSVGPGSAEQRRGRDRGGMGEVRAVSPRITVLVSMSTEATRTEEYSEAVGRPGAGQG